MELVTAPTFRPNLMLEALPCRGLPEKMATLVELCYETPGATIVYAGSRDRCESLAAFLNAQGLFAGYYHAGMEREARRQAQERFMLGRTPVMVATVAFGMGVDKPNVRLVVHFSLPASLEAYTQEAGRAGRDGRVSRCVLLYAPSDKASLSRWMNQESLDLATVVEVYRALKKRFGKGAGMALPEELQAELFEAESPAADVKLRVAISVLEQAGLLVRHPDSGRNLLIQMCPAPADAKAAVERLLESRRAHAERRIEEIVRYAEGSECRHAVIARHFGQDQPPCAAACDNCLRADGRRETGDGRIPAAETELPISDHGSALRSCVSRLPPSPDAADRFELLRAWRRIEAERLRVPPYSLLTDAVLRAMAEADPRTREELAAVPGITVRKVEALGESILQTLRAAPSRPMHPRR